MSRAGGWAGIWAHRGLIAALIALSAVTVAGLVAVLEVATVAGGPPSIATPLVLLGAIALPTTGRELARARREEVGLARLRGLEGAGLIARLAREPLTAILLGVVIGLPLGAAATRLAAGRWLQEPAPWWPSWPTVATIGVVASIAVVGVLAGMSAVVTEELATQVSIAERPRTATRMQWFAGILVVVTAAFALYRGLASDDTAGPDWLVLAAPGLIGLAMGLVAAWALGAAARVVLDLRSTQRVPSFLALRRLGRSGRALPALQLLIAAGVIAIVALHGTYAVQDWVASTARLRAVGSLLVTMPPDAESALRTTRDLDPEGRWLMAAVVVADDQAQRRRVFVDTPRYEAVVGDALDSRTAGELSTLVARVDAASAEALAIAPATVQARRVTVRLRIPVRLSPRPLRVTVSYRDDRGLPRQVDVDLPEEGLQRVGEAEVEDCRRECVIRGLQVVTDVVPAGNDSAVGERRPTLQVESVRFGDFELVGAEGLTWPATSQQSEDAVSFLLPDAGQIDLRGVLADTIPVIATRRAGDENATWPSAPAIESPGGDDHPARIVGTADALPLVEGVGLLGDLTLALRTSSPTIPAAEVMVVAAADTPADVLDGLRRAGGAEQRDVSEIGRSVSAGAGAAQAWVALLLAVACVLMAVVVMAATAARQRRAYRMEVAALRAVTVPRALIRRAARLEVASLAALVVGVVTLAGLVAVPATLPDLPLIDPGPFAVPLDGDLRPEPFLWVCVALAAIIVALGSWSRRVGDADTRPARLREEGP